MERLVNMASFAAVVEAGGFSAAAERLGCSRAVVSKRISALEKDFGVTLLRRTTRRQSMTEAGEALYTHCRRVLDEMSQAESRLHELSSAPRGTLRVSAPHSYGTKVLGPQLPQFLQRYPDISMELHLTDQLADLAGTSVDIAVRMTAAPAPGLVARKLTTVRYVVCASPDYLQHHAAPAHPRELERHNCLFYAGDIIQNPWDFAGPDGRNVVQISGSLSVNSIEILRSAAISGLGVIAIAHYQVCDELARGELVELLADHHLSERAVYLVTLPDRLLAAKTRAFIDFLWQRDAQ